MKLNINSLIPIYGGCIQVIPCKVTQLNLKPLNHPDLRFYCASSAFNIIHADLFGFVAGNFRMTLSNLVLHRLVSICNLVSSNCP